ncbi:MAG: N-acetylmuramoyl-L-alanine amidase [Lachnospiraceae bacterium]|nr:N-acetylmuramoyl-L-alanine amidase [Lachnospiraceae bacterium]
MIKKESLPSLFLSILLLLSALVLLKEAAAYRARTVDSSARLDTVNASSQSFTVVIDSGHGGIDPGNVSSDGTLEKDLNLAIALKLQAFLEANDVTVVMTRTDDSGLYSESSSNKKVEDMKNRVALMEEAAPDLVVSIHQNSYSGSSIKGAQVFYYATSEKSKRLAEILQESLIERLDPDNTRQAKANDTYYLLKKTSLPIVIAECGFMSNPAELELLKSDSYQSRAAWVLCIGIMEYLNTQ